MALGNIKILLRDFTWIGLSIAFATGVNIKNDTCKNIHIQIKYVQAFNMRSGHGNMGKPPC
jgi:hypothetical protein